MIQAVNQDLPQDRFTLEQFAGDLLPQATPQTALATAYHRQTLTNNEGGIDKEEYRLKAVMDRVSNTGLVWLGLTLGCAQCHDHPYDPVTQHEFYELAAIFNNADESDIELPDTEDAPVRKFRVLSQRGEPRTTRIWHRGDYLQPASEVRPGVLGALHALAPRDSANPDRLDLARWLMAPDNPLTPRVAANRLWLHLFGRGLVRTPDDFGARGQPPTHPELLDWLASQYIQRGWRPKEMIRLIVTSAAYRQSSRHRSELESIDPENRLLARQNRLRVEGELVRDLHLAASGLLSHRIGGPSFFPPLPPELVKITFRSELPWKTSQGADRYRRGMYTFFKRSVPYPTLMLFDCPDSNAAAVERSVSNTPMQALATLNNETFAEAAMALALRVLDSAGTDDRRKIDTLFRCCLSRPPAPAELERLVQLLQTHRDWYREHPQDLKPMAAVLHRSEADCLEPAAMAATASIVMNLDEFITRE